MNKLMRFRFVSLMLPAFLLLTVGLSWIPPVAAQPLDEENRVEIVLRDGTTVTLLGEAPTIPRSPNARPQPSNRYHYLPTGLRLSQRRDGTPEFLYLKYTSEAGDVQGGLVHFLMEWGLTRSQESELEEALRKERRGARLMGAASVEALGESGTFRVISATLSSEDRRRSLVMSGHAPVLPGGKVAVAADLDPYGAQLLEASLERAGSVADLSLEVDLAYTSAVPAARGRAVLHWDRLMATYDSLYSAYKSTQSKETDWDCGWVIVPYCTQQDHYRYSVTDSLFHEQFAFLEENNIITVDFEENVEDERLSRIREAFFDFLIQKFTDPAPPLPPLSEGEQEDVVEQEYGTETESYRISAVRRDSVKQVRNETFNFSYRLAFKRPFALVGNLKEWYAEVRDNPRCVTSVNLNDPFFENNTVRFRIDFDAPAELFENTINHAAVTLRKRRPSGSNDFEDTIVFDEDYVSQNGVVGALTFARGDDPDPSSYDYKVQWSFKGGHLYPENPRWESGRGMAAVALSPPVTPRTIEVEADLFELEENGITRVVAEIAYRKFEKAFVDHIMLSPNPSPTDPDLGRPIVAETLFMDRDADAYAYRLIFYSKTEGRFATDWSPQVGETYIFANVPGALLSDGEALEKAKEAAKERIDSGVPSQQAKDVLQDTFKGVFN